MKVKFSTHLSIVMQSKKNISTKIDCGASGNYFLYYLIKKT
ncbi:MAG: hypothetical protein OFPI_06040 [Osedax symbiont Rs2]|nr:MAG: hypothetical protein OFPI_06040 [Osedax symbiont Rs2]